MEPKLLIRLTSLAVLAVLAVLSHAQPFLVRGWISFQFAEYEMFVLQAEVTLLAAWWALARPGWIFRTLAGQRFSE